MVESKKGFKAKVQRFGSLLSGMVMPNIGAFIAWGILTALFIPTGWLPNEHLGELVDPTIKYLLPLLIGYTGGYNVYGQRGGVVGAIATMGIIIGVDVPMFIGAMVFGPLGAYLMKKFDSLIEGKIRSGFEMLVNNFSAGILGGLLMIVSYIVGGPFFSAASKAVESAVGAITEAGLLPLTGIIVAPAQVLFLNNAINHGVFVPLGVAEAAEYGKSVLFMLEGTIAPLVGVMIALCIFGTGVAKKTAPGATIIVLFGGIAEVYFPYILAKPLLVIAPMLGYIASGTIFTLFDGGLVAAASPGSIFAFLAMTPKGSFIVNIAGFIIGMLVSAIVASIILKLSKDKEEDDLNSAVDKMEEMKGSKSKYTSSLTSEQTDKEGVAVKDTGEMEAADINKIIFACDAGMGSSAMGASILNKKIKNAGLDIVVTNKAINNIPDDVDLVVTHKDLSDRARKIVPGVRIITVENFLNSPAYDELVEELKDKK